MPDDRPADMPARDAPDSARDEADARGAGPLSWNELWQIPTIALSLMLIGVAVYVGMLRSEAEDFATDLLRAEMLIEDRAVQRAGEIIREKLDPHLDQATDRQRGRFHLVVADWIALQQREQETDLEHNNQRIVEHYAAAADLGATASPGQIEHWADALISLRRFEQARDQLERLEHIAQRDQTEEATLRHVRVFRRLVGEMLRDPGTPGEAIRQLLTRYRDSMDLDLEYLSWVVARLAEIRLNDGEPRAAIDQILLDLRRIEYATGEVDATSAIGELYTLLGRAYFMIGEDAKAEFNLERGLALFDRDLPARGDALVTLGRIEQGRDNLDEAFERFDIVARDFVATPSHLPGLLGRAEVSSVLGDHETAQADYRQLVREIREGRGGRAVTPRTVARSLSNRHDAALATGHLPLALQYMRISEALFPSDGVPSDVLYRLANSSRQLADNMVAEANRGPDGRVLDLDVRYECNRLYEQAAGYFTRHARRLAGAPQGDLDWADSLWLAAECYDLAGLHEQAIRHLEEYLAGRSREDPRRADVNYRLAQSHHALMQYETAVRYYEQVIAEHPRSLTAMRSAVPLARSYLALDRPAEAERKLRELLSGTLPIEPDSIDYRNALIELGKLYYHTGSYTAAIERLTEAVDRYPDDPRFASIQFWLADSYRSRAIQLSAIIRDATTESPGERRRLEERRREHLATAQSIFNDVCEHHEQREAREPRSLDELDREQLRLSYLYRADCAFELGRYDEAISLYDQAARRYTDHHSSMHALVQIVNCYSELGDVDAAQAAHRRALVRLQRLRDEAFEAPDVIMDREAWERWLRNAPIERTRAASAAISTG